MHPTNLVSCFSARHKVCIAQHQRDHVDSDQLVEQLEPVFDCCKVGFKLANQNQIGGLDGKIARQLAPGIILDKNKTNA